MLENLIPAYGLANKIVGNAFKKKEYRGIRKAKKEAIKETITVLGLCAYNYGLAYLIKEVV